MANSLLPSEYFSSILNMLACMWHWDYCFPTMCVEYYVVASATMTWPLFVQNSIKEKEGVKISKTNIVS